MRHVSGRRIVTREVRRLALMVGVLSVIAAPASSGGSGVAASEVTMTGGDGEADVAVLRFEESGTCWWSRHSRAENAGPFNTVVGFARFGGMASIADAAVWAEVGPNGTIAAWAGDAFVADNRSTSTRWTVGGSYEFWEPVNPGEYVAFIGFDAGRPQAPDAYRMHARCDVPFTSTLAEGRYTGYHVRDFRGGVGAYGSALRFMPAVAVDSSLAIHLDTGREGVVSHAAGDCPAYVVVTLTTPDDRQEARSTGECQLAKTHAHARGPTTFDAGLSLAGKSPWVMTWRMDWPEGALR